MRTVIIPELLARRREGLGLSNGRGHWKIDGGFRAHLTRAQLREIEEFAQANGFGKSVENGTGGEIV